MKCCNEKMKEFEDVNGIKMLQCNKCGRMTEKRWAEGEEKRNRKETKKLLKEWFIEIEKYSPEIKALLVGEIIRGYNGIVQTKEFKNYLIKSRMDLWTNEVVQEVLKLAAKARIITWRMKKDEN